MEYTHLTHWTHSEKTKELVNVLKTSNNVEHTLRKWFVQHGPVMKTNYDYQKHSTCVDVLLLVQDGIIQIDDVPERIWFVIDLWCTNQFNHGFIVENEKLSEIFYEFDRILRRVWGTKDCEDICEEIINWTEQFEQ